jgi:iron complex transport system ATP-binding protein
VAGGEDALEAAFMSLVEAQGLGIPGRLERTGLKVESGSLTVLIGPNGSGKTSLLHALARIGRAAGDVRIGGEEIDGIGAARRARLLAFLPASRDLPWPIAARELIALSGAEPAAVEGVIERLELGQVAHRRADRLSTGERSRVLIARALATAPRLLLLDEPTSNLDPLWQIRLMQLLRQELAGADRCAVVAVHDLDAAGAYADRLIVMHGGRIAADGEPEAVLSSPVIENVFGITRQDGCWRPVTVSAGPRSSP